MQEGFFPAIGVNGKLHYIVPSKIVYMEEGAPLGELAPDGQPWPTTYIYFEEEWALHVKGTSQQILSQWFGSGVTPEELATRQKVATDLLLLPPHLRRRP